jgi:Cu-processing system permease protein
VSARAVFVIGRKEVRDSLRNRWFLLYFVAFAILSLSLSWLSLSGAGIEGFAGFGKTTAGLVNLVLLFVPLMGLTIGAGSLSYEREKGTLGYLLAQPVDRGEVLLGKYLGLAVALSASLALGFGITGLVIAINGGGDARPYATLTLLTFVLALATLSLGVLISTIARRASVALGVALLLWLTFAFVSDLGLMGGTIAFRLHVAELFRLSLINPLQSFKMAVLHGAYATVDSLGPVGIYATQTYRGSLSAILLAALGFWVVAPVVAAYVIFTRRADP